MRRAVPFLIACALAALAPAFADRPAPAAPQRFDGWPERLGGAPLEPVATRPEDRAFEAALPGRFARFRAGPRQVLLRFVERPARQLHSARDCYRGLGYAVEPEAPRVALDGRAWGAFVATRAGERLRVLERVEDADGRVFTDLSAWYWSAALGASPPPYLATAVVERAAD